MGSLGELYSKSYELLCGRHPHLRFTHFQWLATRDLYADLRRLLPSLEGRVLDIGCGDKPYEAWLDHRRVEHTGIDTHPGPRVDLVMASGEAWPVAASSYDAVICTQVLEHVSDLDATLSEIDRILKPGGAVLVTVPFIYNVHVQGGTKDYRRFSHHGIRLLFSDGYDVLEVRPEGGIGSTLGMLLLNWIDDCTNGTTLTRFMKGLLLPVWILLCILVNIVGWFMNRLDYTQSFYSNVLLVARKHVVANE